MANLMADPANWRDYSGATPPNYWTGSAYTWSPPSGGTTDLQWFQLDLLATPASGDRLQMGVTFAGGMYRFLNYVDSSGSVVYSALIDLDGALEVDIEAVPGRWIVAASAADTFPVQTYDGSLTLTPPAEPIQETSYNCECDDDYPRTTLAEMRNRIARRLGFSVQVSMGALPPGMPELLDDFIRNAQEMLFRRYSVFRRERFYTWALVPGTRFYDLDANVDACTKRLDPRMVSWAGISQGDDSWRPLVCGIDPVLYSSRGPGIPSHYEIRQCIELWPVPVDATWKLRIKGQFGLMPLDADDDETTVDPEAIFLLALANAKAHYGQPDAGNYASQLSTYVKDLIRGAHHTRRYLPGSCSPRNAVRPIPVGGWPEGEA